MAVIPAYGRDYKNAKDAAAAWKSGKDFILADISSIYHGKYCSCRDFPQENMEVRYNKKRNVVFVRGA